MAGSGGTAPRSLGRFLVPPLSFLFLFLFIKMIMNTFSEREDMHYALKLEIIC